MGPPPAAPLHGNPVAAILVILIVMILIVGTKVYMKTVVLKHPGWDDWMAIIGAVSAEAFFKTSIY